MAKTLLEQLPEIVANGRKEAERILESIEGRHRVSLQTREWVDDPRFTRQFLIVAPGLIVYERLLDAFCGKQIDGVPDFATSDVAKFAGLFIPEAYRDTVFGFVKNNVCNKSEIGLKATGNGMIAIANWHLLADVEELESEEEIAAPGAIARSGQVFER